MAKEHGNLASCIRKTHHHVDKEKDEITTMCNKPDTIIYRLGLVKEELQTAMTQLRKIQEAADKNDIKEVKKLLADQNLEFGHEW